MLGGHRARRGLPREGRALTKQCPRGMGTVGVWGLGRQGSSLWGAKSLGAAMSEGPHTCLLGSMPRRHGQEGAPGLVYLSTLGTHRKERDGLGGHSDVKGSVRWRQMRRNIKTTSSAIPTQGHKWSCGIQEVSRPGPTNAPSGKPWFSTQTHIHKHMHPHAPTCTHMNTCTHVLVYTRVIVHTPTCTLHTRAHTPAIYHGPTHTHAHKHLHAHTHAHMHPHGTCIHVHICTHVPTYTCVCAHIHPHTCLTHAYTPTQVFTQACAHMHRDTWTHPHTNYTPASAHTLACAHTHVHTCTHKHIYT